jgi:hypothetical protein
MSHDETHRENRNSLFEKDLVIDIQFSWSLSYQKSVLFEKINDMKRLNPIGHVGSALHIFLVYGNFGESLWYQVWSDGMRILLDLQSGGLLRSRNFGDRPTLHRKGFRVLKSSEPRAAVLDIQMSNLEAKQAFSGSQLFFCVRVM